MAQMALSRASNRKKRAPGWLSESVHQENEVDAMLSESSSASATSKKSRKEKKKQKNQCINQMDIEYRSLFEEIESAQKVTAISQLKVSTCSKPVKSLVGYIDTQCVEQVPGIPSPNEASLPTAAQDFNNADVDATTLEAMLIRSIQEKNMTITQMSKTIVDLQATLKCVETDRDYYRDQLQEARCNNVESLVPNKVNVAVNLEPLLLKNKSKMISIVEDMFSTAIVDLKSVNVSDLNSIEFSELPAGDQSINGGVRTEAETINDSVEDEFLEKRNETEEESNVGDCSILDPPGGLPDMSQALVPKIVPVLQRNKRNQLKYQSCDSNCIALGQSTVYVDAETSENIMETSSSPTIMAIGFMEAVFVEEVLKTCTLEGSKRGQKGTIKIGLYRAAVDAILEVVQEHCKIKKSPKWEYDEKKIKHALNNSMNKRRSVPKPKAPETTSA